jgi:hypothetical protein
MDAPLGLLQVSAYRAFVLVNGSHLLAYALLKTRIVYGETVPQFLVLQIGLHPLVNQLYGAYHPLLREFPRTGRWLRRRLGFLRWRCFPGVFPAIPNWRSVSLSRNVVGAADGACAYLANGTSPSALLLLLATFHFPGDVLHGSADATGTRLQSGHHGGVFLKVLHVLAAQKPLQ